MYSKNIKQLAMSGSKGGDRKEHRKGQSCRGLGNTGLCVHREELNLGWKGNELTEWF